jgi:hypothetical protein
MRAIIINPKDRTITATDIDGSLKSLQQIVGGMIEPVSQGLDEYHHCYVDEEACSIIRSISSSLKTATSRSPATASSCPRPGTAAKRPAPCSSTG